MPIARGGAVKAAMNALKKTGSTRSLHMSAKDDSRHAMDEEVAPSGPQQALVEESNSDVDMRINIKRTISQLQRWNGNLKTGDPGTVRGYYALTFYALFFAIFTYVVIVQLQVDKQYEIDHIVRHELLGEGSALASVTTHGDFFSYLLSDFDGSGFDDATWPTGGILGTMLSATLYNGGAVLPADLGMLYQYNKLVGGVLITQDRGKPEPCKPSAYELFYNKCYDQVNMMRAEPCGADPDRYADCPLVNQSTAREQKKCAEKDQEAQLVMDGSQDELFQQYMADLNSSKFGDRTVLDDPAEVKRLGLEDVKDSFEYRWNNYGYSTWLSLADGTETNRQKIVKLKDQLWLDLYTRSVDVKFIFYNGNFGTFSYVAINFGFNTFGMYNSYNPDAYSVQKRGPGGTRISIGTLNMEPYMTSEDYSRLGVELVFMIMVFYYITSFILDLVINAFRGELGHYIEKTGWLYVVMDTANFCCHIAFIVMRIAIVQRTVCNPVHVPTPNYNVIFEEVSDMTAQQLRINFWSILFGIFRFFKYYQFQPRLQIVNKTLAAAFIHILHFMVLFMIIHITFSMIGYLNFGPQNRDFSTIGNAMMVLGEGVLSGHFDVGPVFGNGLIAYVDATMGNLFFHLWAFLVLMILLNIFVAILMDGYALAQEEGVNAANQHGSEEPESVLMDVSKFMEILFAKMGNSKSYSLDHNTLLVALERLDAKIPAPHYDEEKYKKELEDLKALQESNAERIEWLEKMCDSENHMYVHTAMFHPYWHKKSCSLADVANEIPRFNAKLANKFTVEDVKAVYEDVIYEANEEDREVPEEEHGDADRAHALERFLKDIMTENAKIRKELRDHGVEPSV